MHYKYLHRSHPPEAFFYYFFFPQSIYIYICTQHQRCFSQTGNSRGANRKKKEPQDQINTVVRLLTTGLSKKSIPRLKIGTANVCIVSSGWWAPSIFYWIYTHLESWRLRCLRLHSAMTVIALHTQHHTAAEPGTHPPLVKSTWCLVVGDFFLMCSSSIVLSVREDWAALSLSITLKIKRGDLCLVNGPFFIEDRTNQTFWHQGNGTVLFLLAKGSGWYGTLKGISFIPLICI